MSAFWQIDFAPLLVSVLSALSCSLLGSYLLLRRQALMGDALSHVVLPGLAGAFLVTGAVSSFPMVIGAFCACLLAVVLIELLKAFGKFEPSLAMGLVFTFMFALGIILLEQGTGGDVHLDAHHALYGALEFAYWPGISGFTDLFQAKTWGSVPHQIAFLLMFNGVLLVVLGLFFKELRLMTFDPLFLKTEGYPSATMNLLFMTFVAIAAVASFEAVGSILVISLLICPAAAARVLTDDLRTQLVLSAVFGVFSAVAGYVLASGIPALLGLPSAFSAAAMIAVVAGVVQFICMFSQGIRRIFS